MPFYEYICQQCNHTFEQLQKISDPPVKECPKCHKNSVVKLVSAAGFQLKGTGWYVTDFKNKPNDNKESLKKDTSETKTTSSEEKTTTKETADSSDKTTGSGKMD